jgi:hypothetical protein
LSSYGWYGFTGGAGIGLASATLWSRTRSGSDLRGFITIGASGALVGTLAGVGLAFAEIGERPPHTAHFVLQSLNGGLALGAVTGTVAGSLVWLNHGKPVAMLDGAAVGALAGSAVGLVYGLLKGASPPEPHPEPRHHRRKSDVHVTVGALQSSEGSVPALVAFGTF